MSVKPLTPKQRQIVNFILKYYTQHGHSPSLEEIADNFDKAISTIHKHVDLIRKKGYLQKDDFKPRGLAPMEETSTTIQVPLLGSIAAGNAIEAIENPEPIDVPSSMVKNTNDYYALKVIGDSMIDDDVWDGDTILVKHQRTAAIGQMVVASTENNVTLKRYGGPKGNKILLIPRNKKMDEMLVSAENFEIRGIFAGLIRRNPTSS